MQVSILFATLIGTIFLCTACDSAPEEGSQNNSTFEATEIAPLSIADTLVEIEYTKDSIYLDSIYYPGEIKPEMAILTTSIFHEEEVTEEDTKRKWIGLFQNDDSTYLQPTAVNFERVEDVVLDEEGEKTGWDIKAVNTDECLLLIEDNGRIKEQTVQPVLFDKKQIFPEDSIAFNSEGIDYLLYASGVYESKDPASDSYNFYNYTLFLKAVIDGKEKQTVLARVPRFNDSMTQLLFCCDLDGDHILDFIFDTSTHYNAMSPTLYLSSQSEEKEIVKIVGIHTSVGC